MNMVYLLSSKILLKTFITKSQTRSTSVKQHLKVRLRTWIGSFFYDSHIYVNLWHVLYQN